MPEEQNMTRLNKVSLCMHVGLEALNEFFRTGERTLFRKWLVEYRDILNEEKMMGTLNSDLNEMEEKVDKIRTNIKFPKGQVLVVDDSEEISKQIVTELRKNFPIHKKIKNLPDEVA